MAATTELVTAGETVRMIKTADVHPDEVAEFKRHGWVVAPKRKKPPAAKPGEKK